MQALCVRLAVSDAIIAYLSGYIRSFFPRQGIAGEYVVRACYIYFDLLRFFFFFIIRATRESGIAPNRVFILFIYCFV